jgi:hypothetical protein
MYRSDFISSCGFNLMQLSQPIPPPPAMTLGNMRANGVRTLAAWCLGRGCDHFRIVDVSAEAQALAGNHR